MITLRIDLEGIGSVELTGETRQELIEEAAFWNELPDKCPLCKAGVRLEHRKAQGFKFYGLKCRGRTAHESNFGTTKEGLRLFYKGPSSWREAYGAIEEEEEPPQQAQESRSNGAHGSGASRNTSETTTERENQKPVMGAEEAQAKFWELARKFGQTQAALTEGQIVDFLTALSNGSYPKEWTVRTWSGLALPLSKFWKAAVAADNSLKERGKIPTAFLSTCAQIEFGDAVPAATSVIRGEQWELMADRIPHYLETVEKEREEVL